MSTLQQEAQRIRDAYQARDAVGSRSRYGWQKPDALYMDYRKREAWRRALLATGLNLGQARVVDFGCGTGEWLRMLAEWGAQPEHLSGFDLLNGRIEEGRLLCPAGMRLETSSCWPVPLDDSSVDIAACSVVFSSILSPEGQQVLAEEMLRCVRKGGYVAVFDFSISSPRNPDTKGISRSDARKLFQTADEVFFRKTMFPPPLLRHLHPSLYWLAGMFETVLPLMTTHGISVFQKKAA